MRAGGSREAQGFHGRGLPEPGRVAGYGWLVERYGLDVPLPPRLTLIADVHHRGEGPSWQVLTPRHAPGEGLGEQVVFALKWEGVDLGVLAALFAAVPAEEVARLVRQYPASRHLRRLWFVHEWLTGQELDVPAVARKRGVVDVLDPRQQFGLQGGEVWPRQRVRNTLPGTPEFCPLVRRTVPLERLAAAGLAEAARAVVGRTHPDVIARAAAFLQLSDGRASFEIEKERPGLDRTRRWGRAIARAGTEPLTLEALEQLQRVVIGDDRFVRPGLRQEGGFVGEYDRRTRTPLPEHVSARPEDLPSLVRGLAAFDDRTRRHGMDPVVAAACLAFGFVYIHPFADGNGRLHRWLIHHVLAATGFAPPKLVFPVSAAMLREIVRYREVLESYSHPLLDHIDWRATDQGNVEVLNQTARFYRFFDATAHAHFLYDCVRETITRDLPREVAYLEAYDRFVAGVENVVEMPQGLTELLHRFLRQNGGRLSQRARTREFAALTDDEVASIERIYAGTSGQVPADPADEAEELRADERAPEVPRP